MTKSPLQEMGEPLYFIANNAVEAGFPNPPNPYGQSLRTWVRSLGEMQKEALVVSAATGTAWRFACDEGANLGGLNMAPNPLTYLSAGMIASYMDEVTALAEQRGIFLDNLELELENYYYREGDFRKGTMMSSAMSPELTVRCDPDCDEQTLNTLLYEAVAASPLNGLARGTHPSLFTLTHNGKIVTPTQVTPLDIKPYADPGDNFPKLERLADSPAVDDLITMLHDEEKAREAHACLEFPDRPKLLEGQQILHMHTRCLLRSDGVKEIFKEQYTPVAPTWRFLSSQDGRAPDAASLISAGIGLCFMTQLGRFSNMAKIPLEGYRVIQDTHFSLGGASGRTGKAGEAMPVETHVYLDTGTDDYTAQQILGVGERTCFLHAFCRDDVKAKVRASQATKAA